VPSLQHYVPEDKCLFLEEHAQEPQGRGGKSVSTVVAVNSANRVSSSAGPAPNASRTKHSAVTTVLTMTTTATAGMTVTVPILSGVQL